jgi:hypothetical protein
VECEDPSPIAHINFLVKNINPIKNNAGILLHSDKETGLEVNTDEI